MFRLTRLQKSLGACALALSAFGMSLPALAADAWPAKQVRIVVPFPAGGPTDMLARIMADKLSSRWKQPVIVDNKPGGFTVIGATEVARAAPDGYTLFMPLDSTMTMNQTLFSKPRYDPIKDFTHITILATQPLVFLGTASLPAKNLSELINEAKAKPGSIFYGGGTVSMQLAGEIFNKMTGAKMSYVPYKGSAETAKGMLSGEVQVGVDGISTNLAQIKAGKLRPLATTGLRRAAVLPDVPTMNELGLKGYDVTVWFGLSAPAGTPKNIVQEIRAGVIEALGTQEVKDRLAVVGMEPFGSTPEEYVATVQRESAKYGPIIKELGLKLD
ncbi:MAG: tripartite tricarboxylate transporter substrate binding protein [Noviherbaspirillum sp.]|jgi:tripartite-type tricarboxylate transporter receptor subunit TctC|nr:tripartite tricarboxylate transporter substrate binding protein [Noviherbaspirillum sp.]